MKSSSRGGKLFSSSTPSSPSLPPDIFLLLLNCINSCSFFANFFSNLLLFSRSLSFFLLRLFFPFFFFFSFLSSSDSERLGVPPSSPFLNLRMIGKKRRRKM